MGRITLYPDRIVTRWYSDEETIRPEDPVDLARYFFYTVELSPDFTLGDLCHLLRRDDVHFLEVVLQEHVAPLLEEALLPSHPDPGRRVRHLRVHNVHEEGRLRREFSGWGPWDQGPDGPWAGHPDTPAEGPMGVSLTPVNHLVDLPVRYEPEVVFRDEEGEEEYRARVEITLLEFLKAIFFELTFHGPPAERDAAWAEMNRRYQEMTSGEVEGIPLEEMMRRLSGEGSQGAS